MEPLSMFILTGALLTNQPTSPSVTDSYAGSELHYDYAPTRFSLPTPENIIAEPATLNTLDAPITQALSPKECLMREVLSYAGFADGWNGEGSEGPTQQAVTAAIKFINAVPARLPLPRPMLSLNGEIGLYWGLEGGYGETTFELNGEFAFFSRDMQGTEYFEENLNVYGLTDAWFWEKLGHLDVIQNAA